MMAVFSLALSVEATSKLRRVLLARARQQRQLPRHPIVFKLTVTGMHGFQAFMGYILMLSVMTYAVEFLICVVVGLGVGYSCWNSHEEDSSTHVTTNPCCNFMQQEAKENSRIGALRMREQQFDSRTTRVDERLACSNSSISEVSVGSSYVTR
jgi:hypothetical protein